MALVDPYAPCPCGSDNKYKWCCQKAESYIERAQRLIESNQLEAAAGVLNEGLGRLPEIPWLLLRKAQVLGALGRPAEARECCAALLRRHPAHRGAAAMSIRMTLSSEGPIEAVAEIQRALTRLKPEDRADLSPTIAVVASHLARARFIPAALKHLQVAVQLAKSQRNEELIETGLNNLLGNPAILPWLKEPYALEPAPEHLSTAEREQFDRALEWAGEGLFESAASAFELLSASPAAAAAADRNLGFCRLWLGDHGAAAAALRRYASRAGQTTEAVDLTLLCTLISPIEDPDPVELVQLSWPLRNRPALLKNLEAEACVVDSGGRPRDPEDENSPEVPCFQWLDRPPVAAQPGLTRDQIPRIQAEILVGEDHVAVEAHDDGQLNELIDRFTALAGQAIPPAHPRTRVVRRIRRSEYALSWHWRLPDELSEEEIDRLTIAESSFVVNEVWLKAPMETFGGLSPLQAAQAGKHEVALRAELLRLESSAEDWDGSVDWNVIRERLGLPQEPEFDPQSVEVDQVPLGRLSMIPVEALDDDRLARLYARARVHALQPVLVRAARAILNRPAEAFEGKVDPVELHEIVAHETSSREGLEAALEWIQRGRTWGALQRRRELAPSWDIIEVMLRAAHEPPERWVPHLAAVLERYADDERAAGVLTPRLLDMGLLRLDSPPDHPESVFIDSRPLQQLLDRYGPKVATSAGYLGVSATRGEIWTPDSAARGSSTIWTPGTDAGSPAEKPRIIVTGS